MTTPFAAPRNPDRARIRRIAATGTAAVAAYAGFAAVHLFVLNPLAAVPGRSLGEIRSDVVAAGESLGHGIVSVILGLGVLAAVLVWRGSLRARQATAVTTLQVYLALLAAGAPAFFWASLVPGMALADTYGISGAAYSPWGTVLYVVSTLALVGLVVVTRRESRRQQRGLAAVEKLTSR